MGCIHSLHVPTVCLNYALSVLLSSHAAQTNDTSASIVVAAINGHALRMDVAAQRRARENAASAALGGLVNGRDARHWAAATNAQLEGLEVALTSLTGASASMVDGDVLLEAYERGDDLGLPGEAPGQAQGHRQA